MSDEEIIDVEVETEDNLPVVRPSSGMLLRGSEPQQQLEHAMSIATALADVINRQELYKNISGKKHVLVEGWELLGSLLGVFPVVEWTRPVENGWEARVVAKTLDGNEVGSAEMMCTRSESRWSSADDYAIRSMAQTRAISKALRGPLGFVMKLAGYEPTPEGEIPEQAGRPPAAARPFDVERDLLEGALTDPKAISSALDVFDPTIDWAETLSTLTQTIYQEMSWRSLDDERRNDFWRRLSNAVKWIENKVGTGDFPPVPEITLQQGFAYAFQGHALKISYKEEGEEKAPLSPEEAKKAEAALIASDIPFDLQREIEAEMDKEALRDRTDK